jgi:hypothetical protein
MVWGKNGLDRNGLYKQKNTPTTFVAICQISLIIRQV